MNFSDLVNSLVSDTLTSTAAFQPELVLCATIVLILLLRIIKWTEHVDAFYVTLAGAAVGVGNASGKNQRSMLPPTV